MALKSRSKEINKKIREEQKKLKQNQQEREARVRQLKPTSPMAET